MVRLVALSSLTALVISMLSAVAFASDLTKVDMLGLRPSITKSFPNINQERVLVLDGEVGRNMLELTAKLKDLSASPKENAYLVINSPGGSVEDGNVFIDAMQGAKKATGLKTICIIVGNAYSMAAIIASYCHQTYIQPNGALMYHEASYGVQGSASRIATYVDFNTRWLREFETALATQLGLSYLDYAALRRNELWLTANEAVEKGFVDGYVEHFFYTAKKPKEDLIFRIFGLIGIKRTSPMRVQ